MRRTIALVSLAAAFAAPLNAGASPVRGPGVVADEEAVASWMFPTGRPGHSKWIFAGAYRSATAGGGTVTVAFAVKGSCEVQREQGQKVTTCHGRGIGGRVPDEVFEVDPLLREARLVLTEGGTTHRLSWTADATPPSGYLASEACEAGGGQGAGSIRHAAARGELFERRLDGAGRDHALVSRGAMLTECTDRSAADLARRVAAGKTVTVVFR